MGSAARSSSPSSQADHEQAKELMENLVESGHAQQAVDVGLPIVLSAYPHGGASLYAMYTFGAYTYKFMNESQKNGVESGAKSVGKDILTSQVAGEGADEVVAAAQESVVNAAHNEIMKKGVDEANKNLSEPAQRAASSAISSVISEGADVLIEVNSEDERRD